MAKNDSRFFGTILQSSQDMFTIWKLSGGAIKDFKDRQMSFIVTSVLEPNNVVDFVMARLVGGTEFLVVAKSSSLEIYSLLHNDQIKLERTLDLYGRIHDMKTIQLFDCKTFLVLTTDSDKIILVGFKSLKNEFVLDELDIKDGGSILSIQSKSLVVDSQNRFISVYTLEGLLCTYDIQDSSTNTEWKKYEQKKTKKQVFKGPLTSSFPKSGNEYRTPMIVEKVLECNDSTDSFISVLFRDDLFNYYLKTFVKKKSALSILSTLQFPENIKPIVLSSELGLILFGKTGTYLKSAPYYDTVSLSTGFGKSEASTIEVENNQTKLCYIKKSLPRGATWEVTSAVIDLMEDGTIRIICSTASNELYVSNISAELDAVRGEVEIKNWKTVKLKGGFPAARIIQKLRDDLFVSHATKSVSIFKINTRDWSFKIIQEFPSLLPILDFNISGTDIPKIQICGGNSLDSGFIDTEFNGFESEVRQFGTTSDLGGGLSLWVLSEYIILSSLNGMRIFKELHKKITEVDDFHGLKNVDGNVLDMCLLHNELTVMTEMGLFVEGEQRKHTNVTAAHAQANGNITYVSDGLLIHRKEEHKVQQDVSAIFTLEINRVTHILVGYWDGNIELYLKGVKKVLRKADLAINSVLIKNIGKCVFYFTGDAEGHINVFTLESILENIDLNIGDAPVTLVDYTEDSVLAYNAENIFKIVLDENGRISRKGYLQMDIPEAMRYDCSSKRLLCFTNGVFHEIEIDGELKPIKNQMLLPKLVRKSVKFKNFLHLSLFATTTTKYNQLLGREIWDSELRVIDNNTFKTKSVYRFEAGVELTDIVNTEYKKELIDTYEEENIGIGMENILSQCFVVSCSYGSQDEYGPPLMLFSVDELGKLQYQCSCPKLKTTFQSLTNHANRLVIGAGDAIIAYKIEYSIADSKFMLKKVSDSYCTRYFTSHIKSIGADVIVGDIIQGISRLELKVKKDISEEDDGVFYFQEGNKELGSVHFLTAMEAFNSLVITADSLENIKIYFVDNETATIVSQFNIGSQINVIKKVDNNRLSSEGVKQIFEAQNTHGYEDIIPMFVMGSVTGGVYLLSLIATADLIPVLEQSFLNIIRQKIQVPSKEQTEGANEDLFHKFTRVRGSKRAHDKPAFGYINGNLLKRYDTELPGQLVHSKCVLL